MKKYILSTSLLFLFVFLACNKNDDDKINYTDIDIVTGLALTDDNGQPLGTWKSPNDNPGSIRAFPCPFRNFMLVSSSDEITRIWVIPANCLAADETQDISTLVQELNYDVSELEALQVKDIALSDFDSDFTLDLSDLSPGFYRVFYQLASEEIFWTNNYLVDSNSSLQEATEQLDSLCN